MQAFHRLSNGVMAPPIIVGTFEHSSALGLRTLVEDAVELGFRAFDTAPSYGNQELLGEALSSVIRSGHCSREGLFVIDKIDGWQMQTARGLVAQHVETALTKLRTDYLDLLLIHWPFPDYLLETWETFTKLHHQGVLRSIGFCNLEARHLRNLLAQDIEHPHVLQIERHPLHAAQDEIAFCREHGIAVQGYSPVCRMLPKVVESPVLKKIAATHGRSLGQIMMRWHIQSGVAPVFMTKKRERMVEYTGIFDFMLENSEIAAINAMDERFKLFLGSRACPGF